MRGLLRVVVSSVDHFKVVLGSGAVTVVDEVDVCVIEHSAAIDLSSLVVMCSSAAGVLKAKALYQELGVSGVSFVVGTSDVHANDLI